MKVTLAKSAGFCYGVRRAVELAEKAAGEKIPCAMLGPVIHNQAVIEKLQSMGIDMILSPEEAPAGSRVILRSHGEGRDTFETLERRGGTIMDTTCPTSWSGRRERRIEGSLSLGQRVILRSRPLRDGAGNH